MDTWHTTITTPAATLDGDALDELVHALPRGSSAGRSPHGPELLRVSVTLTCDHPEQAAATARILVDSALAAIGAERLDDAVAAEALRGDEYARRLAAIDARHDSGIPDLYSLKQAAEKLGVPPSTLRYRAENGAIPARKVGDMGWAFHAVTIDTLAATEGGAA